MGGSGEHCHDKNLLRVHREKQPEARWVFFSPCTSSVLNLVVLTKSDEGFGKYRAALLF